MSLKSFTQQRSIISNRIHWHFFPPAAIYELMQDAPDMELLRQYAHGGSEDAFAALVARHLNLVYSVALRKTGNPHAAEEVTQAVFIILAKKAGGLRPGTVLPAWLYQAARLTASSHLRAEIRRSRREQEAHMQLPAHDPEPELWPQITPLLEDAMGRLGEKDRSAIVLRYFEGKSFHEVGTVLGASENAAKKRVGYALEKLRRFFAGHGVVSTAAVIAGAMSAHSVQAAPVTLAASVATVAAAKGATAGASTLTLIKGALKLMAWTQAKSAIVVCVSVLLAAGITTVTVKKVEERSRYSWDVAAWEVTNYDFPQILKKVPPQVRILPAKYPGYFQGNALGLMGHLGGRIGLGLPFPVIIQMSFEVEHANRIVYPPDSPKGKYDYIANLPQGSSAALQKEIRRYFGYAGKHEELERDVLFLRVKYPNAPGLVPNHGEPLWYEVGNGAISDTNEPMADFAAQLEDYVFGMPVIDDTGLSNGFNFHLLCYYTDREGVKKALTDQLGLELVPGRKSIDMLVLEKVK